MRSFLISLTILASVAFTVAQSSQASPPENKREPRQSQQDDETGLIAGKVIDVENGDTITVEADGQERYLVKLQAIDAPDVGQPYFELSRKSLSKLILNKVVRVVVHVNYGNRSCIGTVYRDGHDVGLKLLEKGMAWHFKRYAYQQSASGRKSYSDAQNYASEAGIGLWSDERPTPPWVFRGEPVPVTKDSSAATVSSSGTPSSGERKYTLGPRGGCYYVSESGRKVYVQDKSLCDQAKPGTAP